MATVVAIRALLPHAAVLGLVQSPGGHRRHAQATPLVGGIGIYAGLLAGWLVPPVSAHVPPLLAAGAVVAVVGILDDRFQLSPWARFPAHILAAWVLVSLGGAALHDLGPLFTEAHAYVGAWSVPLTLFAVVGVINAMNMSDGMDGLAGFLALVTTAGLIFVQIVGGAGREAGLLFVFAASIAGFLVFNLRYGNRRHARVFLGDAGSTLLGVVLAYFLIKVSQGTGATLRPVTALWLFALPLFDAVGSMLRRLGHGHSPFRADERHYHHYLRSAGMSVNRALAVAVTAAVICAVVGIAGQFAGVPERWMFSGFLALFAVYVLAMEIAGQRMAAKPKA